MKSIQKIDAELEFEYKAHLGEGPVWDEKTGKLWWVDILSGHLMQYSPQNRTNKVFEIGEFIGAAALRRKEGLVLALQSGFYLFDDQSGEIEKIKDPEPDRPGNRFNDGKCDPLGRFWAGTMAHDQSKKEGSLYRLNTDFQIKRVLSDITISNGLAWNPEAGLFYYIDTPTMEICSFRYDEETGNFLERSVIRTIDERDGYPDGMSIDSEGFLWIALYAGSKVVRISPETGNTEFEIRVPVPKPTSCTFGGENLDELFITTCRENMSKEELNKTPLSGSLFKAKVPFHGIRANRFGG